MKKMTEDELKVLLSYKMDMLDDGFTESVLSRLGKSYKRKSVLILAATLLATICAFGFASLSEQRILQVMLKFVGENPQFITLSLLGAVASYVLLPQESAQ